MISTCYKGIVAPCVWEFVPTRIVNVGTIVTAPQDTVNRFAENRDALELSTWRLRQTFYTSVRRTAFFGIYGLAILLPFSFNFGVITWPEIFKIKNLF
jgi:hypothetical protein